MVDATENSAQTKVLRETSSSSLVSSCDNLPARKSYERSCRRSTSTSSCSCCCACPFGSSSSIDPLLELGCCDDYGEQDVYLQSYQQNDEQQKRHTSVMNLSRGEANKLLENRLRGFGPSAGDRLHVSDEKETYSFTSTGGHEIELSIQSGMKGVSISTVIHSVRQPVLRRGETTSRIHRVHSQRRGSYSLMTKMMKCNVMLSQAPNGFGHILACDGRFVFYALVSISCLTQKGKLVSILEDTILKAMEMSKAFADTPTRSCVLSRAISGAQDTHLFERCYS